MFVQFALLILVVSWVTTLSEGQASSQCLGIQSLNALGQTVSIFTGNTATFRFECSVLLNATAGNTTSACPKLAVSARLLFNSEVFGKVFLSDDDCATGLILDDNATAVFADVFIPPNPPTGDSSTTFKVSATWAFCYRSKKQGDDTIVFQCDSKETPPSTAKIDVIITDPASAGRGMYFGMAPFVFVFAMVLACNMILWKRLMIRRMAMLQMQQHQQQQEQRQGTEDFVIPVTGTGRTISGRTGLSPQAIQMIPKQKLNREEHATLLNGTEMCVICQSEYQVDEEIKVLNCQHIYHAECIDSWLGKASSCPICVTEIAIV